MYWPKCENTVIMAGIPQKRGGSTHHRFPMPAEAAMAPQARWGGSSRRPPCCGCPSITRSRSICSTSRRPCRPAARCRRSASWPGSTAPRGPPCGRPWPSWSSRACCCGCRERARSSPSRRSRSRSSSPATPRACASTACTRRPRSSDIGYVTADEQVAALRGVRPGGPLLRVHRLRLADGEPMSIDTSHLPARRFPGLRRQLERQASLYETLRTGYGIQLAEAEGSHRDDPGRPARRPAARRGRGHPAAAAVAARDRHHRAAGGVGAVVVPGDRYKFITRLRRTPLR